MAETIVVGINKMIVTTPGLYIKAEEMARIMAPDDAKREWEKEIKLGKRTKAPTADEVKALTETQLPKTIGKLKNGLMVDTIRLAGHSESNVTFVADAIYSFVKWVASDPVSRSKIMSEPIRSIYYGTESNSDRSRPDIEVSLLIASSKLLQEDEKNYRPIVEMLRGAWVIPVTFACVGGVVSLYDAVNRVRLSSKENRQESALVVAADAAYYDSKKAPGAEATQGAASTLMWITKDPALVEVMEKAGAYHMTLSDFTKFMDEFPEVHGKFSEIVYVYTVARAFENLEHEFGNDAKIGKLLDQMDFFVCHVPFPKQAIYASSFLFVHWLKNHNQKLFAEIQARPEVGKEPLERFAHLTDLVEKKFKLFNNASGDAKKEQQVIEYIENDPEIKRYWDWLKGVAKTKEFDAFIQRLHVKSALKTPALVGNSYTSSAFVSLSSLIENSYDKLSAKENHMGMFAGYGSGAQAMVYPIRILAAKKETVGSRLMVKILSDKKYGLSVKDYLELHSVHLKGESARTAVSDNLMDRDLAMLHSNTLPEGFHIIRRNSDGTGEYAYSTGETITPVKIVY